MIADKGESSKRKFPVERLRVGRRHGAARHRVRLFRYELWLAHETIPNLNRLVDAKWVDERAGQDAVGDLLDAAGLAAEAVGADEEHFLLSPFVLGGKVGTDCHGVVVAEDDVDLRVGIQR